MRIANSMNVAEYARKFAHGHLSFLGPGSEKKKVRNSHKPSGEWDRVAENMMINFSESGHPVFLGSSALERGAFKKLKEKRKCQYIFCGDDETADVFCRTIISVNQLSIYGAVADICDELVWRLSGCSESRRKPVAEKNSETMVLPTELSTTNGTPRSNERVQGNLLRDCQRKFANQIIFN